MDPLNRKGRKLRQLVIGRRIFQVQIGKLLTEVDYEYPLSKECFVIYRALHIHDTAYPGFLTGMSHNFAVLHRLLPDGKGEEAAPLEVPYKHIMCVLRPIDSSPKWALSLHQKSDSGIKVTNIMIAGNLSKLAAVQQDILRLGVDNPDAGTYKIRRLDARQQR